MLQLHPALNLLHHGPVCQSVRIPQRRTALHWVVLLGPVQEQGRSNALFQHGKGSVRELSAWRGSAHNRLACLTPARLIVKIFFLMGNIGGQGQGRGRTGRMGQTQETEGRWG